MFLRTNFYLTILKVFGTQTPNILYSYLKFNPEIAAGVSIWLCGFSKMYLLKRVPLSLEEHMKPGFLWVLILS